MQGFPLTQIRAQAEIEYRRRLISTLGRHVSLERSPRTSLRVILAEALAHMALHLDGRSIRSIAPQHAPLHGQGHGRPI